MRSKAVRGDYSKIVANRSRLVALAFKFAAKSKKIRDFASR